MVSLAWCEFLGMAKAVPTPVVADVAPAEQEAA